MTHGHELRAGGMWVGGGVRVEGNKGGEDRTTVRKKPHKKKNKETEKKKNK